MGAISSLFSFVRPDRFLPVPLRRVALWYLLDRRFHPARDGSCSPSLACPPSPRSRTRSLLMPSTALRLMCGLSSLRSPALRSSDAPWFVLFPSSWALRMDSYVPVPSLVKVWLILLLMFVSSTCGLHLIVIPATFFARLLGLEFVVVMLCKRLVLLPFYWYRSSLYTQSVGIMLMLGRSISSYSFQFYLFVSFAAVVLFLSGSGDAAATLGDQFTNAEKKVTGIYTLVRNGVLFLAGAALFGCGAAALTGRMNWKWFWTIGGAIFVMAVAGLHHQRAHR